MIVMLDMSIKMAMEEAPITSTSVVITPQTGQISFEAHAPTPVIDAALSSQKPVMQEKESALAATQLVTSPLQIAKYYESEKPLGQAALDKRFGSKPEKYQMEVAA